MPCDVWVPPPTLLRTGNRLHTTWTSCGGRPISSSASLRAVWTSSRSLGSLLPPGKHTSPALLLSYTHTHSSIRQWMEPPRAPCSRRHPARSPLLNARSSMWTALRSSRPVGSEPKPWVAPVERRTCLRCHAASNFQLFVPLCAWSQFRQL